MLIRSQDKKSLINLENIICIDVKGGYVVGISNLIKADEVFTMFLGKYSTEEKALKVLDMIQDERSRHFYSTGGEMATSTAVFQPFGFIPPKTFEMPQDSEV